MLEIDELVRPLGSGPDDEDGQEHREQRGEPDDQSVVHGLPPGRVSRESRVITTSVPVMPQALSEPAHDSCPGASRSRPAP